MDDATRALRAGCTRFIHGDGLIRPAELLATIDPDTVADNYGDGGVVADFERYVAELLGKPAAVFLPSGTMAQGATLRVHADRRASRTIAWHPTSHLELHEQQAHIRVHQLIGRPVGRNDRLFTLADLEQIAEPLAALLIELPQREIGGQLPDWDDLVAQVDWARSRGAAVHLDGARLWEAAAGYERSPAEVMALFDTGYVSFYKGIGALPGCCVVGSVDDVAQIREWRRRLGGTLWGLWPLAASAQRQLPTRLAEMPDRLTHARAIARGLAGIEGVRVLPDPPQVPMMHLVLAVPAEQFSINARRLAEEQGIWTWSEAAPTDDPGAVRCELTVGRATCQLEPADVAQAIAALITKPEVRHD